MRLSIVIGIIFITFLMPGCTRNQKGSIAGRITPPTDVARVTIIQNGSPILSVDVSSPDGTYSMLLPAGTYDAIISLSSSPLPMRFPGIVVEPGRTTSLPPVDLTPSSGHAVLSGRIIPAGSGTKISLFIDGIEKATFDADSEGRYRFSELPSGSYTVRAVADHYARDEITVSLTGDQSLTLDMRLLYRSPADGADWASGKIHVIGEGKPPSHSANATIRREMARRAALSDAQRKILLVTDKLKVSPDQSLRSFWGDRKYAERIQGFVQGYTIVSEQDTVDGGMRVELELPLTGPGGLSRTLAE